MQRIVLSLVMTVAGFSTAWACFESPKFCAYLVSSLVFVGIWWRTHEILKGN